MRRTILAPLALLGGLAGAACTAPSQSSLDYSSQACARGDRAACAQVPQLSAQVQRENQQNQIVTGVAAGAGGLLGGVLIGNATAPRYYYPAYGYRGWGCCW